MKTTAFLPIYDKRKTKAIKEYLGLSEEWCKQYFNEWKKDIFNAIDYARKYNYEYVLSADYGTYTEDFCELVKDFNGIYVYKYNK